MNVKKKIIFNNNKQLKTRIIKKNIPIFGWHFVFVHLSWGEAGGFRRWPNCSTPDGDKTRRRKLQLLQEFGLTPICWTTVRLSEVQQQLSPTLGVCVCVCETRCETTGQTLLRSIQPPAVPSGELHTSVSSAHFSSL